jgi:hypothetical protein
MLVKPLKLIEDFLATTVLERFIEVPQARLRAVVERPGPHSGLR